MQSTMHVYEVRPRSKADRTAEHRKPNVISYAKFFSRSHHAVIRVFDEAGNVIETHEHPVDFKEP
jgi:hypothetical protein